MATPHPSSADRGLLNLFTDLMRADLESVAMTLAGLCDAHLDTDPATTGQHLVIVHLLRQAHPDHADTILRLAVGSV